MVEITKLSAALVTLLAIDWMSIGLIDECRRLFRLFKLRSRLVVELLRSLRFAWNWARSSGEIELNRRPDKLEELAAREMLLLSTVGELGLVIGRLIWLHRPIKLRRMMRQVE